MRIINFQSILLALLIFGVLIFVHECGHYLMARLFRVTIREFSIGMGPRIAGFTSKKTGIGYSLRLLPIGGFVSMEGEDETSDDENAFNKKPVWQRILVTVAGASMNLIIGIVVMGILVAVQPSLPSTTVSRFYSEDTPSHQSGLMVGDRIEAVDGTKIHVGSDLVYEIMRNGFEPIDLTVVRDGQKMALRDVTFPTITEEGVLFGSVDFYVAPEGKTPVSVLRHAFFRSVSTIRMIWESLYDLVTGRYGVEAVSGPVGVTEALGEAAEEGVTNFVYLAVVISMNLGIMNLLPLPALDGGRLVFQLIELIRRRPIRPEIEGYVHFAGLVLLMILMVAITMKDIAKLL